MTTNLRVDMDRLAGLAQALHGLADEAGGLTTAGSAADPFVFAAAAQTGLNTGGKGLPTSVTEALNIDYELVDAELVPAVKKRLTETGDTMTSVADKFRNADEAKTSVGQAAAAYTQGTGDWAVPPLPAP